VSCVRRFDAPKAPSCSTMSSSSAELASVEGDSIAIRSKLSFTEFDTDIVNYIRYKDTWLSS